MKKDSAENSPLVVVVGAGVAGLAAAAALRLAGYSTLILEATGRVGGRARTVEVAGVPVDLGASWLHDAEHNPLTAIARRHGDAPSPGGAARERRKYIGDRRASDSEIADFDRAADKFCALAERRADEDRDMSLAEATLPLAGDPWTATVAYWEACLIAAADPGELSVKDWRANLLEGENDDIPGGIGAFVERRLAPEAGPIRLNAPVRAIARNEAAAGVEIRVDNETLAAAACVVTVSTGVLRAEKIAFDPAVPAATRAAIDGLPMGLLTKVVMPTPPGERFGLPEGCSIQRQVKNTAEPMMSFLCFPHGRDHIVGFVGGAGAWRLAGQGAEAPDAFARAQLALALGEAAVARCGPAVVADWAKDPAFLGAYAYARPGHAGARAALAEPVWGGRLTFAGEATRTDGKAGTVGGAYLAGQDAAARVIGALSAKG